MTMKLFQLIQEVGEKNPAAFQYSRKFQISIKLNIGTTVPEDQFSFKKDYCHKIN